ncbi:MAG: hypothetical protein ACTSUE_08270 [Promethearchaeota archaeon]
MKVGIFQFNGCDKCFNEALLLEVGHDVARVADPSSWTPEKLDVAVIAGYLLPADKDAVEKIKGTSSRLVAYGSCATTGGIFGLAYARGINVQPARTIAGEDVVNVDGCLGEVEELEAALRGGDEAGRIPAGTSNLCAKCPRHPTCEYLDDVVRQLDIDEDDDACFNDHGFLCSGMVAHACKESCVTVGTPCRGCKPSTPDTGFRMLGMFATLMANIKVATEATGKGGTDKLADEPDDLTRAVPDVAGSFFRFCLPTSRLPLGKTESTGNIISDVFVGRPLEEIPVMAGMMGGKHAISFVIDAVEAYENGSGLEASSKTKELRGSLLSLEKDLISAISAADAGKYKTITDEIRKIAGNMNLSNIFFGGFKVKVAGDDDARDYKAHTFEVSAGDYSSGSVSYSIDSAGIVSRFEWTILE